MLLSTLPLPFEVPVDAIRPIAMPTFVTIHEFLATIPSVSVIQASFLSIVTLHVMFFLQALRAQSVGGLLRFLNYTFDVLFRED